MCDLRRSIACLLFSLVRGRIQIKDRHDIVQVPSVFALRWIATTASAVIKSCGLAYCMDFTSLLERPERPIPQALRRLPYSSASYAGGLDQAMERSKWLLPFLLVDWTTASAAIMTKSSGFAYFMVFTSFFLNLGLHQVKCRSAQTKGRSRTLLLVDFIRGRAVGCRWPNRLED